MNVCASDDKARQEGCYFDAVQANHAVNFIERYCIPSTLGETIKLLPWQREFVSKLYGDRRADGRRRYRKAILSCAKKNGKTVLTSALCLYELIGGVTPSPFVVSASTARENASQVYRELAYSVRNNPRLAKLCKCLDSLKEIRCKEKAARYKSFSADAGSSEGENISYLAIDEIHAWVSDKLYRSLEYSTVARPDGLTVIISTAGRDQSTLWFDLFTYAQGVQSGAIVDTTLLACIYTTPEGADIDDPAVWRLSNPSLGTSFSEKDFRRDLDRARQGGTADLLSFKRYRLNAWTLADDAYIDPLKWDRGIAVRPDLSTAPLYVGVDLAQTTDPCSVSLVWALPDRRFFCDSHSWVCREGVRRREETNMPKYQAWEADGVLTITPGTANDYRAIKAYLLDLRKRSNLKEIIFDQYNALEMAADLMSEGITVYRQPQNHKHYTAPCKELEIAVTEGRVLHPDNRMLRWALSNCRLDVDSYGNAKPSRDKSTDKIDPAIALLMCFARAVTSNVSSQPRTSVYDNRGVLQLAI